MTFHETVTVWEPGRELAFKIRAADERTRAAFDEHVRIGGECFDVLNGRYVIEEVGPGVVVLHLTSTQRVKTRFNFFTGLWVRAIMSDMQQGILRVIKRRSERAV